MGEWGNGNEHFVGWRAGVGFVGCHCACEERVSGE